MNGTPLTPRCDAIAAELDQDDPDEAANQFYALARKLEREVAQQAETVARLRETLADAQNLRPLALKYWGGVPEFILEFCNRARAALKGTP